MSLCNGGQDIMGEKYVDYSSIGKRKYLSQSTHQMLFYSTILYLGHLINSYIAALDTLKKKKQIKIPLQQAWVRPVNSESVPLHLSLNSPFII